MRRKLNALKELAYLKQKKEASKTKSHIEEYDKALSTYKSETTLECFHNDLADYLEGKRTVALDKTIKSIFDEIFKGVTYWFR